VLDGLVNGHQNGEVAGNLGVTVREVEIHRANVMEKLRVRTLAQALHFVFAVETVQREAASEGVFRTSQGAE
jgi:two-component system, LuxR family, response regulator FixJ